MRPTQEKYEAIPRLSREDYVEDFMRFPGIYCAGCGETFALYSFSAIGPDGVDENGKPFMTGCGLCRREEFNTKLVANVKAQSEAEMTGSQRQAAGA